MLRLCLTDLFKALDWDCEKPHICYQGIVICTFELQFKKYPDFVFSWTSNWANIIYSFIFKFLNLGILTRKIELSWQGLHNNILPDIAPMEFFIKDLNFELLGEFSTYWFNFLLYDLSSLFKYLPNTHSFQYPHAPEQRGNISFLTELMFRKIILRHISTTYDKRVTNFKIIFCSIWHKLLIKGLLTHNGNLSF